MALMRSIIAGSQGIGLLAAGACDAGCGTKGFCCLRAVPPFRPRPDEAGDFDAEGEDEEEEDEEEDAEREAE